MIVGPVTYRCSCPLRPSRPSRSTARSTSGASDEHRDRAPAEPAGTSSGTASLGSAAACPLLKRRGGSNPPGSPVAISPSLMLHDTWHSGPRSGCCSHTRRSRLQGVAEAANDRDGLLRTLILRKSAHPCHAGKSPPLKRARPCPRAAPLRAREFKGLSGPELHGPDSLRRRSAYPLSNRGRFSGARPTCAPP